ncbi:unnamed protein product, partial [Prorocentrum cordatum]
VVELQMLASLAERDGDEETAKKFQSKIDALAEKAKPAPKPLLQDQVSELHREITKLDSKMEAELAKYNRWVEGERKQETYLHDLSQKSKALIEQHRTLVAKLHREVAPIVIDADSEPAPGPVLSLRDLVAGNVADITIDDGGLFSDFRGELELEQADIDEVEKRRAKFKGHIAAAAKQLFQDAVAKAGAVKKEHELYLKRIVRCQETAKGLTAYLMGLRAVQLRRSLAARPTQLPPRGVSGTKSLPSPIVSRPGRSGE